MAEPNTQDPNQKQFGIQKIYLKDVSVETPNTPEVFQQEWKPDINLQLNSEAKGLGNDFHEVVLTLTVTAKLGERTAYLVEVQQAGIFLMQGFSEDEAKPMIGAFCPNTLYPFAREAVSDLVARAGFPQLLLAPINFDALYQQQIQQVNAQVTDAPPVQ